MAQARDRAALVPDEHAGVVQKEFANFVRQWRPPMGLNRDGGGLGISETSSTSAMHDELPPYLLRLERVAEMAAASASAGGMRGSRAATLWVDWDDLAGALDSQSMAGGRLTCYFFAGSPVFAGLAAAIRQQFVRFEPALHAAVRQLVVEQHRAFTAGKGRIEGSHPAAQVAAAMEMDLEVFRVGIYGCKPLLKLRQLRAADVGSLVALSGTVTRTSEVRPELSVGHFICQDCRTPATAVPQQFKYTEPNVCQNAANCDNKFNWKLVRILRGLGGGFFSADPFFSVSQDVGRSTFVDWQKVRVQENPQEIPSGSMPRSIDIIMRNEVVDQARAGDNIVITGALIVVPDVASLKTPGERVKVSKGRGGRRGGFGGGEGVSGLKSLGVREMSYKLAFLASSVSAADKQGTVMTSAGQEEAQEQLSQAGPYSSLLCFERML